MNIDHERSRLADIRLRFAAWSLRHAEKQLDTALRIYKKDVFSDAEGVVFEIGAGGGMNTRYVTKARELILSEPNPYLNQFLQTIHSHVLFDTGEAISLSDESVDVVMCSLVLCSVDDVGRTLAEMTRVLRHGGTFRFVEHVAAPPGTWLRRAQDFFQPLCTAWEGGCHPNRDIESTIRSSGLKVLRLERFSVSVGMPLVRDFIAGIVQKPNPFF